MSPNRAPGCEGMGLWVIFMVLNNFPAGPCASRTGLFYFVLSTTRRSWGCRLLARRIISSCKLSAVTKIRGPFRVASSFPQAARSRIRLADRPARSAACITVRNTSSARVFRCIGSLSSPGREAYSPIQPCELSPIFAGKFVEQTVLETVFGFYPPRQIRSGNPLKRGVPMSLRSQAQECVDRVEQIGAYC